MLYETCCMKWFAGWKEFGNSHIPSLYACIVFYTLFNSWCNPCEKQLATTTKLGVM